MLLPDSWTLPTECTFTCTEGSYSTNSYTKAQWTAMEAAGAVFLPATGARSGGGIERGSVNYWSSTPYSSDVSRAYYIRYMSSFVMMYDFSRDNGKSVRPVMVI